MFFVIFDFFGCFCVILTLVQKLVLKFHYWD